MVTKNKKKKNGNVIKNKEICTPIEKKLSAHCIKIYQGACEQLKYKIFYQSK